MEEEEEEEAAAAGGDSRSRSTLHRINASRT